MFGEYILLLGARALALPVQAFQGYWASGYVDDRLKAFADSKELATVPGIDLQRFKQDIESGWYFESNIPQGYGLGSSGALCAGVYDRFVDEKTTYLPELKSIFAGMEGYFHGQSSGIDPLTSYLNRPLWIENKQEVRFFETPNWLSEAPVIFLLDTQLPRHTGPLVEWFLEKSRQAEFLRRLELDLLPAHDAMLQAWEFGDHKPFWSFLEKVSAFQLEFMHPMIPDNFRATWADCISEREVLLKICGAGGGGFILGFAQNKKAAVEQLNSHKLLFPFEQYALVEK